MTSRVFIICDAYESGIGHGAKRDGHRELDTSDAECAEAYSVGYELGEERSNTDAKLMGEHDPNGKQPHEPGAKMDAGKSPLRRGLLEYFPRACLAIAEVSAAGAKKYTWNGWESVTDGVDRYGDAGMRHVCKAAIEGANDSDTGLLHAAHEAWNALARLELLLREGEKTCQK